MSVALGLVGASAASSLLGGAMNFGMQKDAQAFNAQEAERARMFEAEQAGLTREFNSSEAQKARDWNEYMASTSYQRTVADMKAAGINPASIGGNGSGSPGSFGGTSSASSGTPGTASAHSSASSAMVAGLHDALYQAMRVSALRSLATSAEKDGFYQVAKRLQGKVDAFGGSSPRKEEHERLWSDEELDAKLDEIYAARK